MMPAAAIRTEQIERAPRHASQGPRSPLTTGSGPICGGGRRDGRRSKLVVLVDEIGRIVGFVVIEVVRADVERLRMLLQLLAEDTPSPTSPNCSTFVDPPSTAPSQQWKPLLHNAAADNGSSLFAVGCASRVFERRRAVRVLVLAVPEEAPWCRI